MRHPLPDAKRRRGPCNSWTFCNLPVCWGLDTGWNHTYGECWLRYLEDPAKPIFGQRGRLSAEFRQKHMYTRPSCKDDAPWACPPTHVPWTSGSLNGGPVNLKERWETSGSWGEIVQGVSSACALAERPAIEPRYPSADVPNVALMAILAFKECTITCDSYLRFSGLPISGHHNLTEDKSLVARIFFEYAVSHTN
eukprot:6180467-Pleurochrysis_carterae.AAC.1